MAWYQYRDEDPTNGLPQRIRLDDGMTRTSLHECSIEELKSIGFSTITDPPHYNSNTQDLIWNNAEKSWFVSTTTDAEKIKYAWQQNDIYKSALKQNLINRIEPFVESGGSISTHFNKSIEILDGISSTNYQSPFDFNWCHPSLLGYTEKVVLGISSTEYRLVNQAIVDFVNEVYLPNQN